MLCSMTLYLQSSNKLFAKVVDSSKRSSKDVYCCLYFKLEFGCYQNRKQTCSELNTCLIALVNPKDVGTKILLEKLFQCLIVQLWVFLADLFPFFPV